MYNTKHIPVHTRHVLIILCHCTAVPTDQASPPLSPRTFAVGFVVGCLFGRPRRAQSWADASLRAGLLYYPKLLVGVPFTPAAGARVLIDPALDTETREKVRRTVALFLR